MTFYRLHIAEEVALPSLTFQFEPHCGQCDIWLGGVELAKEVAFTFLFCCYFEQVFFFFMWRLMTCRMQLFVLVVKLLVSFYKDENIVTFLFIHTIQLIFTASKTTPFFF